MIPTELQALLQALGGVVSAPWFTALMLVGATVLGVYKRRAAIVGFAKSAYGKVRGTVSGRVGRPTFNPMYVMLILAGVSLLSQRGCDFDWRRFVPNVPSIVTVEGPRTVVVLHETEETTPELSQAFISLRTGENAGYMAAKKHKLLILDDDAKGVDGAPVPLIAKLATEGVGLPAAFILNGDAVVAKKQLAAPTAAVDVMALLKGAGG